MATSRCLLKIMKLLSVASYVSAVRTLPIRLNLPITSRIKGQNILLPVCFRIQTISVSIFLLNIKLPTHKDRQVFSSPPILPCAFVQHSFIPQHSRHSMLVVGLFHYCTHTHNSVLYIKDIMLSVKTCHIFIYHIL